MEHQAQEQSKQCPMCGERILQVAILCKHCGARLDQIESARRPRSKVLLIVGVVILAVAAAGALAYRPMRDMYFDHFVRSQIRLAAEGCWKAATARESASFKLGSVCDAYRDEAIRYWEQSPDAYKVSSVDLGANKWQAQRMVLEVVCKEMAHKADRIVTDNPGKVTAAEIENLSRACAHEYSEKAMR
jgi:hypothetical protein